MVKRGVACLLAFLSFVAGVFAVPGQVLAKEKSYYTFDDINARYVISADIKADGYGDGYHSKLVFLTVPECGVSFGLQYDKDAYVPYKERLALIFENVFSNNPGKQRYYRPSDVMLEYGRFYNLMMSMDRNGAVDLYFEHQKIASYLNRKMAGKMIYPQVEGSAKHNGDYLRTEFMNVQVKCKGYDSMKDFKREKYNPVSTISSTVISPSHILIEGHLSGLNGGDDWDSAYNYVSGIVHYVFDPR